MIEIKIPEDKCPKVYVSERKLKPNITIGFAEKTPKFVCAGKHLVVEEKSIIDEKREERILRLEQNGFHQEWRGSWVHESGTGYFTTYDVMQLNDAQFERLIECNGDYYEMFGE